ncbi:MAG: glycosyltransferase family 2 protein [Chlamydiales bacterium]|nr:glycosyltransferase family 2 protein [Chlamydiales bacterium]
MKVCTIIVNWNNKKDTIECLHSLAKVTYPNHTAIVVDNGSTDDSFATLSSLFPQYIHLATNQNLGFAGGNNVGIKHAITLHADAIILLNNDTVVHPEFIEGFITHHYANTNAILGGKIYQYQHKELLDHLGGNWDITSLNYSLFAKNANGNLAVFDHPTILDYVVGCCMFIPTFVVQTIGLLDEQFFLLWEEADFCMRAKKAGVQSIYCPGAVIWHKGSQSFTGGSAHMMYYWWRNRILWMKKNLSKQEFIYFLIIKIFPAWLKLHKRIFFLRIRNLISNTEKTKKEIKQYTACIQGGLDAFRGRYGIGPNWITKK